jgi:glycosyltransferase involved in cell wall biosynthesis
MVKKILFVITKSNWGGAQRYVYDLATRLPKDRFAVKVIYGGRGLLAEKLAAARIPSLSFEKLWRDVNTAEDLKAFFKLLIVFWKERPHVVHLNSSKIGGLGAFAARLAFVPKIIFTVHGFAFNEERSFFQKKVISFLSWLTVFLSTDVICISQGEYEQVLKWPLVKSKVRLIYNGITPPAFLPQGIARTELAKILNKPEDYFKNTLVAGSIAELTKNKGLEFAIEALKANPRYVYVVIGAGEEYENLQKIVTDNHLTERIFFTGFIKEASRYLKAFDVFLLPSRKEGLPYVLIEAGFAGVPAIASNVGGIPELIVDKASGFLTEVGGIDEIRDALEQLETKLLRVDMGELYTKKVMAQCDVTRMISTTSQLYV